MTDFTTELLAKPNFEDGLIGGWNLNAYGSATFAVVDAAGQSFQKALQVTAIVPAAHAVADNVSQVGAPASAHVYVSGWLNMQGALSAAAPGVEWLTLNGANWLWIPSAPGGAGWEQYTGKLSIGPAAIGVIPAWVSWVSATAGDVELIGPQSRSFYDPAVPSWLWLPSYTPQAQYAPRVLDAKFGDGYRQRAGDGINSSPETWNLRFAARDAADAQAMLDFLGARAGVQSFQWIAPDNMNGAPNVPTVGNPKLYIAPKYTMRRTSPLLHEVSVTFEEVFDL
jgi:phage-related protein